MRLMPSPSADSKFVLSIPKIFKHTQFFNHTQNVFGILKSGILLHKLDYLSILKTFWVYFKNLSLLKNLSILKENFGSADGLGIGLQTKLRQNLKIPPNTDGSNM